MTPEVLAAAVPRARARPERRVPGRRAARPQRALGPLQPAPARAEVPDVHAAEPAAARGRQGRATSSGRCATATCCCTTRTTRSRTRSRRSSSRPRSDPHVLAIKQTLYRTGGDEAGIVASLVKAAEAGKQVVALVELKARFDEQANIERARMLEQAGAHVVYGLVGLKTHAKILLVVRQEADGIRRYCHVGTGNYNPKTATTLRRPRRALERPRSRRRPLRAVQPPHRLQPAGRVPPAARRADAPPRRAASTHPRPGAARRRDHDEDERARRRGDDRRAVRGVGRGRARSTSSCAASAACAPGVPGLSENITVRSIVGRYLEHSRIIRFGEPGDDDTEYVIGSADLMPRNLDRRVEAMLRVTDPRMRARLDEILDDRLRRRRARVDARTRRHVAQGPSRRAASSRRCGSRSSRSRAPKCAAAPTRVTHEPRTTSRSPTSCVRRDLGSRTSGSSRTRPSCGPSDDPEAVHQARVATRRLRSDLRTFDDFVDEHVGRRPRAPSSVARRRARARSATSKCSATGCAATRRCCPTPKPSGARA